MGLSLLFPYFFVFFVSDMLWRAFITDLLRRVLLPTCCVIFYPNLLGQIIVLSTVSFFVVFALVIQMTKFNSINLSNQIMFVSYLES